MSAIHASCVAIEGRAVLIAGPSGCGKSDLALRLIDRGAELVSDDYTAVVVEDGVLVASAPTTIAAQIEVRGIGIIPCPARAGTPVALRIESGEPERMPEAASWAMAGIAIPMIRLNFLEPSAPLKVELALKTFGLMPA